MAEPESPVRHEERELPPEVANDPGPCRCHAEQVHRDPGEPEGCRCHGTARTERPSRKARPARRGFRGVAGTAARILGTIVLFALGLAFLLTALVPGLFAGLVLFLVTLAPLLFFFGSLLAQGVDL